VAGPEEGIPRGVRGSARGEAAGGEEMGQEVSAGGETLTLADEACVGGEGMPGADGNGARGAVATERGRKAGEGRGWREE
jgi:hypothetical protein